MQDLQGFRTIIFNIVAIAAAWLTKFVIDLPQEHQNSLGITIIAIINIILRLIIKTPVGKKGEIEPRKTKIIK
jgi:hypothetical protein